MPDRKVDIDLTNSTEPRISPNDLNQDPTSDERAQFGARIAQVLDRTLTVDRTSVPTLPANLDSYWCANDNLSKHQAELRGFVVDTEFAKRNGLNDTADGKIVVGDVFHMVRPKWMKEMEDKAKAQKYYDNHLSDKRKQKEERDFLANNELQPIMGSKMEVIQGPQIEEATSPKK